jgi:cyclophilin family peptidyl-prolyl cis-trans isomerase
MRRRFRSSYRPFVQQLEVRCLLAAPVIDPIQVPLNIPVGKTLVVPISAVDPAGGSVSYTVTSSNPDVTVTQHTGNSFLELTVAGFGTMEFELFDDLTPQTVATISGLVNSGFYNGLTFHRVIPNFVIQGGDPNGDGTGGPGFSFNDEYNPQLVYSGNGQLAMANSGPDTNGSQFFITSGTQRGLDFNNAIFGQLIRGFDVLQAIESVPTSGKPNFRPLTPVVITSAQIVQDNSDAVFTLTDTGTTTETTNLTITASSSTGGSTTETLAAQVIADPTNDPPILGPVSDAVGPAGSPITVHLTRTDLENDASTFEAIVHDPANASAVLQNVTDTSADVVVTPLNGFTGAVQVTVGVEEKGATARGTTTGDLFDSHVVTVTFGDKPLTFTPGATINATEGGGTGAFTLGTLTDADTSASPTDFQIAINWGDGTLIDTTSGHLLGATDTPGIFRLIGLHAYKETGTFPIEVMVTDVHKSASDNGGATATTPLTGSPGLVANVTDAALAARAVPVMQSPAGPLTNTVLATFTDGNVLATAGEFAVRIDWGDGTNSPGTVSGSGGTFRVLGSHTYAAPGRYAPTVTITDTTTSAAFAGVSTAVTTSAVIGTANERFLAAAFQALIGQPIDAADLGRLNGMLARGVTRVKVVQQIEDLPQFQLVQVQNMYKSLLGAPPTSAQLAQALHSLATGGSLAKIQLELLTGSAFFQQRGGGSNAGFVSAVAQVFLQQSLDAAEQAKLVNELSSGTSRADIVRQIAGLQLAKEAAVTGVFQQYLQRPPNGQELSAEVQKLSKGEPILQLIAEVVGSTEFFDKV